MAHTYHFEAGEANLVGDACYRFTLPSSLLSQSVMELSSFETGVREPTVEDGCDRVRWTEGFEVSVGEASMTVDGQSFPVFNHEIVLRETQTDASVRYFKLGLAPHLNEVSYDVHAGVSWAGLNTTTTVDTSLVFITSPRTQPPPHYLGAFQAWAALRAAASKTFPRAHGVCMATHGPLDAEDAAAFVSNATQPGDSAPPINGDTAFTLGATGVAQVAFDTAGQRCVTGGFWTCEPWFVEEAVDFLNYQLTTVTNCKDSATNSGDYCNTDSQRPTYRYQFVRLPSGRVALTSADSVEFSLLNPGGADAAAATYEISTVYATDASAVSTAAGGTAPTTDYGRTAHKPSCGALLGFGTAGRMRSQAPRVGTVGQVVEAHGLPAGLFDVSMRDGFYTGQTFASNLTRALNGTKIPPLAHSHASAPHTTSDVLMLRASHRTVAVAVSSGPRTPFELAEALGAALTRADPQGAVASASAFHQAEPTTQKKDADDLAGVDGAAGSTVTGRAFYTVTYNTTTGLFQIQRQLSSTLEAGNSAATAAPPFFVAEAREPPDEFELSFHSSDVPTTLAAALGVSSVDTERLASMLGFVQGVRYQSAGNVLTSSRAVHFAAAEGTRTRGLVNDVDTNGERPLDQSVLAGPTHRTNELLHCGSGPPNRRWPRWLYNITAAHGSDLRFTVAATRPAVSDSHGKAPNSLASGLTLTLGVTSTVVTTATTITSAGTLYQVGDYVVVNETTAGGVQSPSDAVFKVVTVTGNGAVATIALVHPGSGVTHNPPTTYGYQNSVEYDTSSWDAQGPLRMLLAQGPATTTTPLTAGLLHTRAVVQNAMVQERRVASDSAPAYRTTGAPLGVSVGDVVVVGGLQQAVHLTLDGTNDANKGGTFTTVTVTTSTTSGHGGAIETATFSAGSSTQDGELYLAQGGNNQAVVRVIDASADTFALLNAGRGYVAGQAYVLKGPLLESCTALVTDVLQPMFRRTTAAQAPSRFAYLALRRATDGDVVAYGSYGRENQLVKLRLPFALQPLASSARPSNLPFLRHWARPRFSLVRPHVPRDATVWQTGGLPPNTSTVPASSTTFPFAVDTSAASHCLLVRLVAPAMAQSNQTFVTSDGVAIRDLLAKVTYGRMVSKTWSSSAKQPIAAAGVTHVDLQFSDAKLQPFNFRGSNFSIALTFYPMQKPRLPQRR
jgi:hypothetical protein